MRKCDVGGQAIIEGVMMRGSKGLATAVRTPSGKIEVKVKKTKPITKRYRILNIPIIRGAAILIDSLIVGINTLNYSASFFEEDEEESKFDIWLKNKLGDKGANDLLVTITMMISLIVAAGLFLGIPTAVASIFKNIGLHPRCGTNFLFLTMIVSIILFTLTGWGGFWQRLVLRIVLMPIVAGITYELIKWLGRTESKLGKIIAYPGLKLQELTTKEPNDEQLEVAIKSLMAAEGIEYKKTIGELLIDGNKILKEADIETYILDTQLLLGKVLGKDKLYLITNKEEEVSKFKEREFYRLINKRKDKMPIKYILKSTEFMGLDFQVEEGVLIPRGDTEILVEETLKIIDNDREYDVCDLCCGSGAIGISIAYLRENTKVDLIDYYDVPEKVTKRNITKHNLNSRATFIKSDLLEEAINQQKKYDILVSNPPYIKEEVIETLMDDVKKYEPHTALSGGEDGLYFYKKIVDDSDKILKANGTLAFEIGHDQSKEVSDLMLEKGYKNVRVIKDLAGHDRVVIGEL